METLRARATVVLGSGQTSVDRKLLDEFSLKPQKKNQKEDAQSRDTDITRSHLLISASTAPSHSRKL